MGIKRAAVLSIAGFDPCGGAGVLADIKTFEKCRTSGMAVATSVTYQNESEFEGVRWLGTNEILTQIELLVKKYDFKFVKLGLIKDLEMLSVITGRLKTLGAKIIWDPIMQASAGFKFHSFSDRTEMQRILEELYLITPNTEEACSLSGNKDAVAGAAELAAHCRVYLKGGHSESDKGRDRLFTDGKVYSFRPGGKGVSPKHGSGCVFSSALAAELSRGFKLHAACLRAKSYVTKYLSSNKTLLGYHS